MPVTPAAPVSAKFVIAVPPAVAAPPPLPLPPLPPVAFIVVIAALLQTTLTAVFKVALFRFATRGDVVGQFSQDQLSGAFRPKVVVKIR